MLQFGCTRNKDNVISRPKIEKKVDDLGHSSVDLLLITLYNPYTPVGVITGEVGRPRLGLDY